MEAQQQQAAGAALDSDDDLDALVQAELLEGSDDDLDDLVQAELDGSDDDLDALVQAELQAAGGEPEPEPELYEEMARRRLRMVYHTHNPAKLVDVDALLQKHAKSPEKLYEAVLGKYGVAESFFAAEHGWEASMRAEAEAKARAEARAKAQAQREQVKLKNDERIAARKLKEEEASRVKAANAAKSAEAAQRRAQQAASVTPEEQADIDKRLAKAAVSTVHKQSLPLRCDTSISPDRLLVTTVQGPGERG